ncbi:MAG: hypothetical protein ACI3ZD_15270 [Prevotella sp.]
MKLKYLFLSFVASIAMMFTACSPDEYDLGAKDITAADLVEGVAFSITHDAQNPNIVYLENLMPGRYKAIWEHPQGRSLSNKVTLKIPFAGEYEVKFGVETRGGYVYGEPAKFKVDDMYAGFISDPMWSMIAGGSGKSKTWVLDLDADKVSRHFLGPIYFFTKNYCWDNLHNASGGNYLDSDPWDATSAIVPNITDGAATWYWLADYAGNSWMCDAADFGTMTFDLIGGANVVTDQEAYGLGTLSGTYLVDTDAHTIKFSGAWPVHDSNRDSELATYCPERSFNILYLTDDFMQLLVPETGVCYNYISTDYRDNWTPGEQKDPEPTLPDGWQQDVSQTVITNVKWVLSDQNPLDWCNLDGSRMNGWASPSDYPDWLGTPDPSVYADFSMTLESSDQTATFVTAEGEVTMKYTLDEKGIYTFDGTVPSHQVVGWAWFNTDGNNQLRIMSIEKDAMGNVSGMWLGARSAEKPEYLAYHFIPQAGTASSDSDPLSPWKKSLCGKTFKPDVNYWADWIADDWTGGWTAYIYPTDFASQNWFWTQETYDACEASSLSFYEDNGKIMVDAVDNGVEKKGISVSIDTDAMSFEFSEAPLTYSWILTNNAEGKGPWLMGSYNGANLSNISTHGLYLGYISKEGEITMVHYVLAE